MKKTPILLYSALLILFIGVACSPKNNLHHSDSASTASAVTTNTTVNSKTDPVIAADTTKKISTAIIKADTLKDSLKNNIAKDNNLAVSTKDAQEVPKTESINLNKESKSSSGSAQNTPTTTTNVKLEKHFEKEKRISKEENLSRKVELKQEIAYCYSYQSIDKTVTLSDKKADVSKHYYANGDIKESNKNTASVPQAMAGLLTGGETNDLGKWKLWNDLVKSALDAHIKTWKIYPYSRYTVLLQNQENMPVQGAKVALVTEKGNILWEAITDNTGTAQLWKNIYSETKDSAVLEIQIDYKGKKETIKKPVDYFHGINTKTLKTTYIKPEIVDIAFVVDATGSMQDEINFLKEEMNDIIGKTKTKYEKIDLYIGSLFYRCQGNSYVTKHKPLTKDYDQITDFIKEQNAGEGGTESVEIALQVSIDNLEWHSDARTRLIFLVLDEPAGYHDTIIQKLHTQIQAAAKKGIKIIPVVASGKVGSEDQNRKMEYLMRSMALATNGNYIFITDHSGIGDSHTEPIIDNYEVELINDIIVRTIENNIYMPDPKKPEDDEIEKDTLLIDNQDDLVSNYIDSLSELISDDSLMGLLLPYTEFNTIEELKKHLPIKKIDTAEFLADHKKEVHTLKVYPNPSTGNLKAEFNVKVDWLYIADLSGKLIQRLNTNGNQVIHVDLNDYPNGLYIIQYPDKDKWISAKIVLQK